MKICIIDDEWVCHLITQKLIEKIVVDSQIMHFTNGQDAFEFIAEQRFLPCCLPELIFLDINMPIANGWKFLDMLQDLKVNNYNPAIYISSSSLDIDDIDKAKTYPAVHGYLPKPLTPVMLKKVLKGSDEYCLCPPSNMKHQFH